MFHVKICGITNSEDARVAVRAGADAIGLNFFAQSPRFINHETASEIITALPPHVVKVGVFVDATVTDVCRLFDDLRLDLIQLHGSEPPEYVAQLGGRPVMRAFRAPPAETGAAGPSFIDSVVDHVVRCHTVGAPLAAVLLDALVAGQHGGTGRTMDWNLARDYTARADLPPLVLAGGLTPENVAEAILAVHPAAVDTASGVEQSPGHKDPAATTAFVRAAKAGIAEER